jgi:hypothetical protein
MSPVWVSKNGTYHYHIGRISICRISDILNPVKKEYKTAIVPDTKCLVCKKMLKSGQFIKNKEKKSNDHTVKKYGLSLQDMLLRYMSWDNTPKTISDMHNALHGISDSPDDTISDLLVRRKISYDNGLFCIVNVEVFA